MIRRPVPERRSSGSEYPVIPIASAKTSSPIPISQLISRGLRYAPVKKTRSWWMTIAATKTRAAQWWICRMTSPARTSKLMSSVETYAADSVCPWSGRYEPSYTTGVASGT